MRMRMSSGTTARWRRRRPAAAIVEVAPGGGGGALLEVATGGGRANHGGSILCEMEEGEKSVEKIRFARGRVGTNLQCLAATPRKKL
jgi:hypothetical protein